MNTQSPQDSAYLTAIGTATTDAVIAMTKTAKPYARFTVKAEVAKDTHWLSVIAFDSAVVDGARQIRKGARVDVGGRLQVRTWTGTDGKERTSIGIVASALTLLADAPQAEEDPYENVPF